MKGLTNTPSDRTSCRQMKLPQLDGNLQLKDDEELTCV